MIDGFRIDHPDGLADPEGYLERLHEATDGGWVVVEKILEGDERLPSIWDTAGTTGYDALSVIQTAMTPGTGDRLDRLWRELAGDQTLADVEHEAKRQVVTTMLAPEVARLARRAAEIPDVQRARPAGVSDTTLTRGLRDAAVPRRGLPRLRSTGHAGRSGLGPAARRDGVAAQPRSARTLPMS